jgi:hypothetical protein
MRFSAGRRIVYLLVLAFQCWHFSYAIVLWHNLSDSGCGSSSSAGITTDVYNDNIDIIGTNAVASPIHIVASTANIIITVTNTSSVLTQSGNLCNGQLVTSTPRLYLFADTGRVITFSMTQDFLLRGTNDQGHILDLLVAVSGAGQVVFEPLGDHALTFSSLVNTGGAQLYVAPSLPGAGTTPTVIFQRLLGSSIDNGKNSQVKIGNRSLVGFTNTQSNAAIATNAGTVSFDSGNTGTGQLYVHLYTGGQVNVSPRLRSGTDNFALSNIQLNQIAGGQAVLSIINSQQGTPSGGVIILNENQRLTNYASDPFCDGAYSVTGTQVGFILGANGYLQINPNTYLEYVGATTNQCPNPNMVIPPELRLILSEKSILKLRNPSAFIIDGSTNASAANPIIQLADPATGGAAGLYFLSAVNIFGEMAGPVNGISTFTVDQVDTGSSFGNIVWDIEAPLKIQGTNSALQAVRVLSLLTSPTGGTVTVRNGPTIFPLRTFAANSGGDFLQYGKAAIFNNSRVTFTHVSLVHDDENHQVLEKNDIESEALYQGGEHLNLVKLGFCSGPTCYAARNKFVFHNAPFHVLSNAAFTGMDLLTPNSPGENNLGYFIFYGNGRAVDMGTGRQLIMGTDIGGFACDGGTVVDRTAHIDIIQEQADASPGIHRLTVTTQPNDVTENNAIQLTPNQLLGQGSIHTIYLGHESNISIGTQGLVGTNSTCNVNFALTTTPNLHIGDSFFSFDTRGGSLGFPELSGTTGEGGIFVDTNGLFDVEPNRRGNISTMVTKSRNGAIRLPRSQIFFSTRVGIQDWQLNLADPTQIIILPRDVKLSDYTLDWMAVSKDYTGTNSFVPYEYYNVSDCTCTPIKDENIRNIPEIHGTVDQFQIKRSRLGDMAHIKVGQSGYIKELVFLSGYDSAEAPVGLVVLQDDGRVGLGNAERNFDSTQAAIVLGINGVVIVPNGNGEVQVNNNLIVNNFCHILAGTAFGTTGTNYLTFLSEIPQEIRVKKGGVLDLTSMTSTNQVVEISGQVSLVMETGSLLRMGGGTLQFTGQSQLVIQQSIETLPEANPPVTTDDPVFVTLTGTGVIIFGEQSALSVREEGLLSVETYTTCSIYTTNISLRLQDSARFNIGSDFMPGGVFQIGNTVDTPGTSVNFELLLNGLDTEFEIGQRGFLGLGVGVIQKEYQRPANTWTMGSLFNVGNIKFSNAQGKMTANTIVDGDDLFATLIAVGNNTGSTYTFTFNTQNVLIRGGSNMVLIPAGTTSVNPQVTTINGSVTTGLVTYQVGLISTRGMLIDPQVGSQPVNVTPTAFFNYLAARSVGPDGVIAYASPKSTFATDAIGANFCGYIFNNTQIFRAFAPKVIGDGGYAASPIASLNEGGVNITTNSDGSIATISTYVL